MIQLAGEPQVGHNAAAPLISSRGNGPDAGLVGSLVRHPAAKGLPSAPPRPNVGYTDTSPARRVVGLILILAAAYLVTMPESTWQGWTARLNRTVGSPALVPGTEDIVERPAPAGGASVGQAESPLTPVAGPFTGQWLRWCLAFVCATGLLLLHRGKPINFLLSTEVTAALMAIGASCAGTLLHVPLSWRILLLVAVGVGYLIQTTRRPSSLNGLGVVGVLLVTLACLGAAKGWFGVACTYAAAKAGPAPVKFVAIWNEELAWGLTVFLAMLGALWSRAKPVHFLTAMLLAALAYHCVDSGRVVFRTFAKTASGELVTVASEAAELQEGAAGSRILKIEDESLANVRPWRWVVTVEMLIVAVVLLYKSLGIGSLNVAFALMWMFLGSFFYESLRSASLLGFALKAMPGAMSGLSTQQDGRNAPAGGPLDIGLASRSAPNGNAARQATDSPNGVRPGVAVRPLANTNGGAAARSVAIAVTRLTWREIGLPVWVYLTAILAGIIAISGLHVLWAGTGYRLALTIVLWVGFAASLTALWFADCKPPDEGWLDWLAAWSQSGYKLHVVWLIFLSTMAVAGSWALRRDSRTRTWLYSAVVCAFLGTGLTLLALALAAYYGGAEPVQGAWKYGAIAAGQSSLAWVLLMYLSRTPEPATA